MVEDFKDDFGFVMKTSFRNASKVYFLSVATGRLLQTIVLPAFCDSCVCRSFVVVVVWDGQKLEFLSRAQSDWAETSWRSCVGIPD
jgi:hypothetical protein